MPLMCIRNTCEGKTTTTNQCGSTGLACSRRSASRAREKNSRRKKKKGRLEGERGKWPPCSPPPPRSPGVQFNSLPTDRRALLSERLEQATTGSLVDLDQ